MFLKRLIHIFVLQSSSENFNQHINEMNRIFQTVLFLIACSVSINSYSQKSLEAVIGDSLTAFAVRYASVGRINNIKIVENKSRKIITISTNDAFSHIPFRPENVAAVYDMLRRITASRFSGYSIVCQTNSQNIDDLIPNFYRTSAFDNARYFRTGNQGQVLVKNISRPYTILNGLHNKHIALWQSHGWYYNQQEDRWRWQRAKLFHTVEDLFTQAYVLNFLVPMLENAGANVLLPRERDTQTHEVIVDFDISTNQSKYREQNERKKWTVQPGGFGHMKSQYLQGENPFEMGTYRRISVINDDDDLSTAEWQPSIPEKGRYAVYVSYKSLPESAPDAVYSVYHLGGVTQFKVNQTMYGGTWLYLGHFKFDKGRNKNGRVVLTNKSAFNNKIITADAVKFGGGMGNIARSPNPAGSLPNAKSSDVLTDGATPDSVSIIAPRTSAYPRFTEAARYWLQWAGIPDSVYSKTVNKNDYTDDFQSRGNWVNYVAGGSSVIPQSPGMGVPLDMAFAFHTDAGTTMNDSIIGTLGIFTVLSNDKSTYANGASRWAGRDLTDIVQTQIVEDIRASFAPEWTRRGMWNRSYSEARVPEVPTMLLELLSHQNFADMRYGLDPRFQFTVSRAIYKGILKYLSASNGFEYVVQPLPVTAFSTKFVSRNKVELQWEATVDSLETTAKAERYMLYTRIDDNDFDNGVIVNKNKVTVDIKSGRIYSFKVTAINRGGESFPSEILSAYRANNDKAIVLIVNGFDRISGPESFVKSRIIAGFSTQKSIGVPYMSDISFIGEQYDFDRTKKWISDDNAGFGASDTIFETNVIAGNNLDFCYLHGLSIANAGYSFVSSSAAAVAKKHIKPSDYRIINLILGKQKKTFIGNHKREPEFATFPAHMQQWIIDYTNKGGNMLISGAYVGSDMHENGFVKPAERLFVENTLRFRFGGVYTTEVNKIRAISSPYVHLQRSDISYFNYKNKDSYHIESADILEPMGAGAVGVFKYDNNRTSGVAYVGKYRLCVLGFPFETIKYEKDRNKHMEGILNFLNAGN